MVNLDILDFLCTFAADSKLKNMKHRLLAVIFIFFSLVLSSFAQQQGMDALRKDYPLLMEKFGAELENQRADYFFIVDVSGSMQQYKDRVVPALGEFFQALQPDDYVSVIKFGGAAKNDIGSHGKVNEGVVKNLINYAPNLYDIPNNPTDRNLYFNFTDLYAMMQYLADEMHAPGLNKLKFIFIITDFEHFPTPANRGKENWEGIKRQLANEQSENYLYAFALQLPGKNSGRDLDKVTNVFPVPIDIQEMQEKEAFSEWFSHKRNRILLDKFTALIKNKIQDPQVSMKPDFTRDGYLTMQTAWQQNELFDRLSVDGIILNNRDFRFKSYLPVVLNGAQGSVKAGKVAYKSISLPLFHTYGDSLTAQMSYVTPFSNELLRLGIEPNVVVHTLPAKSSVFTFILPLWLTVALLVLLILYLMAVVRTFMRNRSAIYKVNGEFIIKHQGLEIIRKKVRALRKIDIGNGASVVPVVHGNCNWLIEIRSVAFSCLRIFKKPAYRVYLLKGNRFKTGGREYLIMHHPFIARGSSINIDDFSIRWIP